MAIFTSLAQRLSRIVEPLRATLAAHAARHRATVPLIVLLHRYLHRLVQRFAALTDRLDRNCPAAPSRPKTNRPPTAPQSPRPPRAFALLGRMTPNVNVYGSQLRHLLASEEMKQLLDASPQAASILRPLCRMLGVGPPDPDLPRALFPPRRPVTVPVPSIHPDPLRTDPAAPANIWPLATA